MKLYLLLVGVGAVSGLIGSTIGYIVAQNQLKEDIQNLKDSLDLLEDALDTEELNHSTDIKVLTDEKNQMEKDFNNEIHQLMISIEDLSEQIKHESDLGAGYKETVETQRNTIAELRKGLKQFSEAKETIESQRKEIIKLKEDLEKISEKEEKENTSSTKSSNSSKKIISSEDDKREDDKRRSLPVTVRNNFKEIMDTKLFDSEDDVWACVNNSSKKGKKKLRKKGCDFNNTILILVNGKLDILRRLLLGYVHKMGLSKTDITKASVLINNTSHHMLTLLTKNNFSIEAKDEFLRYYEGLIKVSKEGTRNPESFKKILTSVIKEVESFGADRNSDNHSDRKEGTSVQDNPIDNSDTDPVVVDVIEVEDDEVEDDSDDLFGYMFEKIPDQIKWIQRVIFNKQDINPPYIEERDALTTTKMQLGYLNSQLKNLIENDNPYYEQYKIYMGSIENMLTEDLLINNTANDNYAGIALKYSSVYYALQDGIAFILIESNRNEKYDMFRNYLSYINAFCKLNLPKELEAYDWPDLNYTLIMFNINNNDIGIKDDEDSKREAYREGLREALRKRFEEMEEEDDEDDLEEDEEDDAHIREDIIFVSDSDK